MTEKWWFNFFDSIYGDYILHSSEDHNILADTKKLVKQFQINKNTTIFDQCCGKGALSIPLLNYTSNIYGIDITPYYINQIKENTNSGTFEVADAFDYTTSELCDLVFNWHTSFGYSEFTEQNQKMINNAHNSLKDGGYFLMEYINFEYILNHFKPRIIQHFDVNEETVEVTRHCSVDKGRNMLCQKWSIDKFKDWERYGETKIYSKKELIDLFHKAGFKNIEIFFDLDKKENIQTSQKIYVLGQK